MRRSDSCCPVQGTKPEVRTYNTIINACNRSQQPEHALKVYDRMISDGTQPTATTYTALISAYGKTGKVGPSPLPSTLQEGRGGGTLMKHCGLNLGLNSVLVR